MDTEVNEQQYLVKGTATGAVHDAEGKLISTDQTFETEMVVNAQWFIDRGMEVPTAPGSVSL